MSPVRGCAGTGLELAFHDRRELLGHPQNQVTFFVGVPGKGFANGQATYSSAELVDLFATLVELCRLPAASGLEGPIPITGILWSNSRVKSNGRFLPPHEPERRALLGVRFIPNTEVETASWAERLRRSAAFTPQKAWLE